MDHEWPAYLSEDGAACEVCGLLYAEWSDPESLKCQGSPEARLKNEEKWVQLELPLDWSQVE